MNNLPLPTWGPLSRRPSIATAGLPRHACRSQAGARGDVGLGWAGLDPALRLGCPRLLRLWLRSEVHVHGDVQQSVSV